MAQDWARDAADEVLSDLVNRPCVGGEIAALSHEIWEDIRKTAADIIRRHAPASTGKA
jgi:hypothetical protein